MQTFLYFISFLCQALAFIVFLRALLSWFNLPPNNPIVVFLNHVTEPILAPLRRLIPRIGMVDITPMVAILLLVVIGRVVLLI